MKICLINAESVWKNIDENLQRLEDHIISCKELFPETQVGVFPELTLTGYILDEDNEKFAIGLQSVEVQKIQEFAEKYSVYLVM